MAANLSPSPPARVSPTGPSVLIVFPWCLDRLGHGNIQRVLSMGAYLAREGVQVDLVYQGNPGVPSRERQLIGFRRIVRVETWHGSADAQHTKELEGFYSSFEPPPANLAAGPSLTTLVRGLLDAIDYTAVIASYAWTAPVFEPLARRALRVVDLHDVIHAHGERSLAATGVRSPFWMPEETERYLWRQWDLLLAITPQERRLIEPTLRPAQRLLTVPHAVRSFADAATPGASGDVLYVGSDNPSNRQAVEWLVGDVWPRVIAVRPDARLRLVGLICDAIPAGNGSSRSGVDLVGFVDDPEPFVCDAAIVVAPYLYGTGLKIKVVEAAAAGKAIVTTTSGIEGTGLGPGTDALVADRPGDFAAAVVQLLADEELRRRLGEAALGHARRHFPEHACYGELLAAIRAHVAAPFAPGAVPPFVEERLRLAIEALRPSRVIVWGNGSHTRWLLASMARLAVTPGLIVDKSARQAGVSAEGVRVVAPSDFVPAGGDLIVLSSQSYESEMWADLEPLRDRGVQVLALYRRDLVVQPLQARIAERERLARARSRQPDTRAASAGGRLVIAEPSAGRSRGPFLRFALSLRGVAASSGREVIVAGARQGPIQGLEPEERDALVPAFEFAHWDVLRELDDDPWRAVARFSRFLADDLAAMAASLDLGPRDTVLFHTANLVEVLGAAEWLAGVRSPSAPAVRLLFHFLPSQESQWLKVTERELRSAYALALPLLENRAGGVSCLAQSSALADALAPWLERAVVPIGFAVPERLVGASSPSPSSPPRLLYAGEARTDKGFGLLPALAGALAPELRSGAIRLVCQAAQNEFADARIRDAVRDLSATSGVELLTRFLPSRDYDELVAGADIVLLPYDAEQYRSRLSAIFVDATCSGVPVVVPAGTWMANQVVEGLGVGTTFESLDADTLADAVRRLASELTRVKIEARQAAHRCWARHDPRAVLEAILAG